MWHSVESIFVVEFNRISPRIRIYMQNRYKPMNQGTGIVKRKNRGSKISGDCPFKREPICAHVIWTGWLFRYTNYARNAHVSSTKLLHIQKRLQYIPTLHRSFVSQRFFNKMSSNKASHPIKQIMYWTRGPRSKQSKTTTSLDPFLPSFSGTDQR
jgi:hypothetical protein